MVILYGSKFGILSMSNIFLTGCHSFSIASTPEQNLNQETKDTPMKLKRAELRIVHN